MCHNPYIVLPLIGRLLELLATQASTAGTAILVSHRDLARDLGCSPSMLPRLMAQLEADGHIRRERAGREMLITVIYQPITPSDQSTPTITAGDQSAITGSDRSPQVINQDIPQQHAESPREPAQLITQGDRSPQVIEDRSLPVISGDTGQQHAPNDGPHAHARSGNHDSSSSSSYAHTQACDPPIAEPQPPPIAAAAANPTLATWLLSLGAAASVTARIIQHRGSATVAELEHELATARQRGRNPLALAFGAWQRGERINPAPEVSYGQPTEQAARQSATNQPRRSARPSPERPRRIDAANPGLLANEPSLPAWLAACPDVS